METDTFGHEYRVTNLALLALQESAEMYLTQLFEDSDLAAMHSGRVTLTVRDLEFILFLRGRSNTP